MGVSRCGDGIALVPDRKMRRRSLADTNETLSPATQPAALERFSGACVTSSLSSSTSSSSFSVPSPSTYSSVADYDGAYPSRRHQCRCPSASAGGEGADSCDSPLSSSDGVSVFSTECRVGCGEEADGQDSGRGGGRRCVGGGRRGGGHRQASPQCLVWPCLARASFLLLVLMSCLGVNVARPLRPMPAYQRSNSGQQKNSYYNTWRSHAVKYLAWYGYLAGPSRETGYLMSEDSFHKALKTLQRMGNISVTGRLTMDTVRLMTRPRCGNLDSEAGVIPGQGREELAQGYRAHSKWGRNNLTYSLLHLTPDLDPYKVRETISNAFNLWSNNTRLTFKEVRPEAIADIQINFTKGNHNDGYPFDGKGLILAHAFFPGKDKGGDTHFDEDELWTLNDTSGVDLYMVAAHEFGHALGLAHSANPQALMYPWYQGYQSGQYVLNADDISGIQSLYGSQNTNSELPDKPNPRNRDSYDVVPDDDDNVPPDPCTSPLDAITIIRSEIFVFIGKWFWRMDSRNITKAKGPIHIHKFWYGLPHDVVKIDAAFERPRDKRIIFFAGDRYWIYNANSLVTGFPSEGRPITEFGIPADVKQINTIFTWGFNKRTYLVSKDLYWKLDENNTYVEYDYPRDISIWQGVPEDIDAAFLYQDDKTYFFKDRVYWKFYDLKMMVDSHYPRSIAEDWMECTGSYTQQDPQGSQSQGAYVHRDKESVDVDSEEELKKLKVLFKDSKSSAQACTTGLWLSWLSILTVFCIGQGWRAN